MNDVERKNNDFFSKVATSYNVSYLRACEEFLVSHFFKGKVLVLGCGAGRTLTPLARKGFDVVGIDINQSMVGIAVKTGVPVYCMSATHLEFEDESFDTVFFPFHGIDYIYPDIYKAVAEAKRVLKKDGVFVMSSHNRFYIKKINQVLNGPYAHHGDLVTYRTTPFDFFKLRRFFRKVRIFQRISIATSWKNSNWKDKIYRIFSFFNKSTYFVCFK